MHQIEYAISLIQKEGQTVNLWCRGIRGAITAQENTRESILAASKELLQKMLEANEVQIDDIASIWLTTTPDLNAEFPAVAARDLGCLQTALLCGHEMNVPGSLSHCIRVLILFNTEKKSEEIVHVYLKEAQSLRPEMGENQLNGDKP